MFRLLLLLSVALSNLSVSTAQEVLPNSSVDKEIAVIWDTEHGLYCSFKEDEHVHSEHISNFFLDDRWRTTATNGSGIQRGDPITITWSIVPDGTLIPGSGGEPDAPSELITVFDDIYNVDANDEDPLSGRIWFPALQQGFEAWAALSGINLVYEPNDDGAAFPSISSSGSPGVLGVRGDVRVSGHSIDGQSGPNTLAYNFFPDTGDMVIDTDNEDFYGNPANNFKRIRQVIAHEHGHGLGISHSCPTDNTKLMEPFINLGFDGPQEDDILAGNRGYGDVDEFPAGNDSAGTATNLGALADGSNLSFNNRSIDGNSDQDFFSFTVPANHEVSISLTPTGTEYLTERQDSNGTCPAGMLFDALTENDLALELRDQNGTSILTSSSGAAAGIAESILDFALDDAGTYFVRIDGSMDEVQMYQVDISVESVGLPDTDEDGVPDSDDNCPAIPNPLQTNSDDDLLGDACDDDDDNDGVTDTEENDNGFNPIDPDSDGDGIQDDRDPDPGTSNNQCTGPNPVIQNQAISGPFVCAGDVSVTVEGTVETQVGGNLLIISPTTKFNRGFRVEKDGSMKAQAADPCPVCE